MPDNRDNKDNNENDENIAWLVPLIIFIALNGVLAFLLITKLSIWYLLGAVGVAGIVWAIDWKRRKKNVEILKKQREREEKEKKFEKEKQYQEDRERTSKHSNYKHK